MCHICRPVAEGGVGFDYRLQMAIADKWIEVRGPPSQLAYQQHACRACVNLNCRSACMRLPCS